MNPIPKLKSVIDDGRYINIHGPCPFNKAEIFSALADALEAEYIPLYISLQAFPTASLQKEELFAQCMSRLILQAAAVPEETAAQLQDYSEHPPQLDELFRTLRRWCKASPKPIVLILDNIDAATGYQPFLDFLAMLRMGHIQRAADGIPTFHSVILIGETAIHDLERAARKKGLRYTPWNIAENFDIMS